MPNQNINIVISAEDKTSRVFSSVERKLEAAGSRLQAFSGLSIAATGALAGLAAIGKKSIDAFSEQEQITAKLTTLILNQKGATVEHVKALEDQAAAMQQVTTFGDEAVMAAQAQLATFDLTSETIQKLIPGFLDMVAAEKGAIVSSEEMKFIANGLGKAIIGQTDALVKQGFIFTELQKEILDTGTEEERLQVITEVMGRTYNGVAAELKEGFTGQLIVLKNRLGEVGEIIGAQVLPVLIAMANHIIPIIEKVGVWIEKNPELATKIGILTVGLLAFVAVIAPIGFMIAGISAAMSALLSPIGLVLVAVVTLAAAIVLNFDKIKIASRQVVSGIHEVIDAINMLRSASVGEVFGKIKSGLAAVRDFASTGSFTGQEFDNGGVVQGPLGSPQLVKAHAGETILPTHKTTINLGGVTINNGADMSMFFRELQRMQGGQIEAARMGLL